MGLYFSQVRAYFFSVTELVTHRAVLIAHGELFFVEIY